MKQFLFYLVTLMSIMTTSLKAQNKSFENDTKTIDALMRASYEVVSGEKGAKRQWERDNYLHHPKAVYSYFDKKKQEQVVMTLQEFHKETDDMVFNTAFYENEINREVRIFGNIAHVWSTYETRLVKGGKVERRGINSIQLIFEHNRWYIISWTFSAETNNNLIPKTFDKN
ncbi:hypothetical protein [Elizabethkingia miricola]|uniref:Nuclear transport factor 2 family protein n=2 Tax=Elizabethkingia miricola TaxID=172045 RepID=A0ABY3NHH8_ELIMR|nr:hypothetical protein [Elizabethkingia miricola]TYO92513.1 hypothetical protein LX74_01473 [Elizabethkingia miricola]UIO95860.1 hypothetical protein LYZ41_16865 [Elizabethkingia miricola]WER12648.1 hypothetical protein P0M31_16610 [Elizabethkingia miricola]WGL72823.1 hypothetical protein QFB80_16550 [Elizabethkingia miricola]